MRVPSSILSVLKHHAGEASPGDENIQVPAFALPTLEIPGGLSEATPNIASPTFRAESFISSFALTSIGPLAASDTVLAGLRPGLWELHLWLSVSTDFAPGAGAGGFQMARLGLRIPDDAANLVPLVIASTPGGAAPIPFNGGVSLKVSLERESTVVCQTPALGAANGIQWEVSIYAARLL